MNFIYWQLYRNTLIPDRQLQKEVWKEEIGNYHREGLFVFQEDFSFPIGWSLSRNEFLT